MLSSTTRTSLTAAILTLLVSVSSLQGQVRETEPDSALAEALAGIEGSPIGLLDVVERAARRAPVLAEAEAAVSAAEGILRSERGMFDPELFAEGSRAHTEQPATSAFSGANVLTSTDMLGQTGVRTQLPFGTQVEATLNATSLETNSRFTALNPQYNAFGELAVRQPLLAGAGPAARAGVEEAEGRLDAAWARLDDSQNAVRAFAEDLYWRLFAGERDLAVQYVVRDNAAAVLEEARLRAEAGLVGPNQVENARVFLAEQELAVLDREEALDAISDELSTLIGAYPPEGSRRFKPAHGPDDVFVDAPVDTLVAQAIRVNPSVRAIEFERRALTSRLEAAQRNRLPSVDLVAAVRSTGLAGSGRTIVFGSDTLLSLEGGDFFNTWNQVGRFRFPRWTLGVDVRVPIGGRSRGGEVDRLAAERERIEAQQEELVRAIVEEIRLHHRAIERSARRLEIARTGVEASQAQVRLGLIEYRNGRTTAFELVRLGADLAAAERRYSQELVRAARAAAALRRLTGDLITR